MCGIFSYLGKKYTEEELLQFANKISHRGPDSTKFKKIGKNLFFTFFRLAINGLNPESGQPMEYKSNYLICNGEIFNYRNLIDKYNFHDEYKSESDCEIILHLYNKFGIDETCKLIDGEFAFVLYDGNKDILYSARDHLGIRSLYWGRNGIMIPEIKNGVISNEIEIDMCFCSELKGFPLEIKNIEQFPVASYWRSDTNRVIKFYNFISDKFSDDCEETIINNIRELFTKSVEKRLMSDRKLACLLSGGLDSTTVSAIVANKYEPYTLSTYSIGLKGSIDLHYAKIAADYFKTKHTSIELTNEDFLGAIEKTIKQIESYDTTSVRASVGNYLISLYIKENSDDTVIFCGDVSDEIFASYRGFYYADSDELFHKENIKMLENISYFDVLRSDKSISGAGLEARVPFSDKDFLKYCMSIKPCEKRFNKEKMEKYLFRKAFEHLMPKELVWRVKTAFSDGVSNEEKPWYEIIKDYMDTKYTDEEYEKLRLKYTHNQPYDKESLYYREVFEEFYPNMSHTIPYFWKQPFMGEQDPSAWLTEKNKK
jgi:asparagine synthase (glutamine-hydrolysing)